MSREFGYKKDGVRWQDETLAKSIDDAIKQFLDSENIAYTVLTGSTKERAKQIYDVLGLKENKEN